MKPKLFAGSLLVLAALLLFCSQVSAQDGKKIKGDGNIRSETRNIGDFSRIDCPGSFHIFIKQGSTPGLKVEGDENLLPYISTSMDGKTLTVKAQDHTQLDPSRPVAIYLTVKQLEAVNLSGLSKVETENTLHSPHLRLAISGSGQLNIKVEGKSLNVDISGTGKVHMEGHMAETEYRISGTGDVEADDLVSDRTRVLISGIGKLRVNTREKLNVSISGTGKVWYKGNPAVSQAISGIGKIAQG